MRILRLALLVCDTPVPQVVERHGAYPQIFTTFLRTALKKNALDSLADFELEPYDVVKGIYPNPEDLTGEGAFDGILISGSAASAYDPLPWITQLVKYTAKLIREYRHIKVIGICFGQQIIARACGGDCVRNEKGWEVGTTTIELTEEGKRIFRVDSGRLAIQQMHRDHVPALPPSFELLGSSPVALVQGIVLKYPSPTSDDPASAIQVFAVQGHPEFKPDIVSKIIDVREKSGAMDAGTVKAGRENASKPDDGVGAIGRAIWSVMGISK
ncbi:hypothetical protein FRB99_006700 [Tulasnella sp. 403]|nr:hypothetical protein FRB99_006700 [Tulasnella sp. 403]